MSTNSSPTPPPPPSSTPIPSSASSAAPSSPPTATSPTTSTLPQPIPSVDPEYERMKSLYRLAIETRNFEIQQVVQRNSFFMIFQGVLLAGLMQASGGNPVPIVSFLICLCGLGISLLQAGMAAGAKFWQERWEAEANHKETKILQYLAGKGIDVSDDFWKLFTLGRDKSKTMVKVKQQNKNGWLDRKINWIVNRSFSVSRIPIYAGMVFSLIWACLLGSSVQTPLDLSVPKFITGFQNTPTKPDEKNAPPPRMPCSDVELNGRKFILCEKKL